MKTPAFLAVVAAAATALVSSLPLRAAPPALTELALPLTPVSPAVTEADQTLHRLLKGVVPGKKTRPTVLIKDRQYILYGDLFHTHENYALVQIAGPAATKDSASQDLAALALWQDGAWQLRGLWKIPVTWRPEGWQPSDADPLPDPPATQAFTLKDLNGDGVPEVVIAGLVGDNYQDLTLFRFSAQDKTLYPLGTSRDQPVNASRYVVLYDKSPGHPIWGTWQYFQWAGSELAPVAFWHDQVPFDGVGDTFIEAEVFDKTGHAKKYHIVETKESLKENTYAITLDGQPYATITFLWRKAPDDNTVPSYASVERAYLYRKLTGLTHRTYPAASDEDFPDLFENQGTVQITGRPEAVKALSGHSK